MLSENDSMGRRLSIIHHYDQYIKEVKQMKGSAYKETDVVSKRTFSNYYKEGERLIILASSGWFNVFTCETVF